MAKFIRYDYLNIAESGVSSDIEEGRAAQRYQNIYRFTASRYKDSIGDYSIVTRSVFATDTNKKKQ